jgi:hypothetical protein
MPNANPERDDVHSLLTGVRDAVERGILFAGAESRESDPVIIV